MRLLILSTLLILSVVSRDHVDTLDKFYRGKHEGMTGQREYVFDQITDHFNYNNVALWKQRYWVIDDYFTPSVGPVFLFICGESTCKGVPERRQWIVTLAQRLKGLVLVLQHRFYGKSLPFANDSFATKNLQYLNSQQALSDLAYFIQQMKETKMYKIANNPWISVGGSYPGALSAWFRYKYPHLVIGGIASSAVILAIEDFPEFDEQIYVSSHASGDFCDQALNASNSRVEQILNSAGANDFKKQFQGGDKLTNDEFLFFWADSIVLTIQYGNRTFLCEALKGKTADDQFTVVVNNAKNYELFEYGSYYLKNQTFQVETGRGSRCWYFQSCTEYGFWQTPSKIHPMRSKRLDLNFYKKFCADSFGAGTWPKIFRKNIQYGGLTLNTTNLLMANGVEDPWRWASLQQSKGKIISRVANCTNCAHCVDLNTPSANDDASLKKIRDEQFNEVTDWINTYWRNVQKATSTKTIEEA